MTVKSCKGNQRVAHPDAVNQFKAATPPPFSLPLSFFYLRHERDPFSACRTLNHFCCRSVTLPHPPDPHRLQSHFNFSAVALFC